MTISKYEIQAASKVAHFEQEYRVMAAANKKLAAQLKFAEQWIEENEGGRDFKLYLENVRGVENEA